MTQRIRIDPGSRMPLDPVPELEENAPLPPAAPHPKSAYVELGMRSNYSFLQAASPPEALVEKARELGYDAISLTDRDGFYGMVRALERCRRLRVRLIVGVELTVSARGVTGPYRTVRVHVANPEGYRQLCRLLTRSHALHPKGKPRKKVLGIPRNLYAGLPHAELFAAGVATRESGGLWVMAGHEPRIRHVDEEEDERFLRGLRDSFGERASVSVHLHKDGWDRRRVEWALEAEARFGLPGVAIGHVLYAEREGKTLYDVLHCIGEGVTLDEAGRRLSPNAEARLKTPAEMVQAFRDHPGWIARTRTIADACTFDLGSIKYKFPCELEEPAYPGETPDEAIRRLTYAGARAHHHETKDLPPEVQAQIEAELALIAKMEVAPYFLSVRTIVDMARDKNILCQGRGSAANSAVCHALGITAIDPVRSKFLFARFLSEERHEPPDIDVDFEHERREEVIQEIYRRYGRKRAAMVSEVICYRGKSALRDVGKVFGLTLEQVERLSTVVTYWDRLTADISDRLAAAGFDPEDRRIRLLLTVASALQGFPRHLSIHVGGFVLSSEDLENVAPIEPATMKDRTVIPWDKDDIDVLGFFKVDVLGLGMLTALRRTFQLLEDTRGEDSGPKKKLLDQLRDLPAEDEAVYEALQRSDSVGVFQVESRAQMAMLPRLKPTCFYDLVVEVAIVRPGPIQGGMIHPYLRRRSGEEKPDAPHPVLDDILARTLGVPLFQEQVMQIAIHGAGYTGGEADQLRRDMAAWRKNGNMEAHKARLARGFAERGIPEEFSARLYEQIKGFGEYGFPESHAASFALLVYASAYLKVHHPAAFAAAMVNSQPMGFYSSSTLLEDAKRHGIVIRPVCIDASRWDCQLEARAEGETAQPDGEPAIRLGLRLVRGLGEDVGRRIDAARAQGSFVSVEDLACRAELDGRVLDALAESGALEPLVRAGGGRRDAMWSVRAPLVRARAGELFAGLPEHDASSLFPRLEPLARDELLALDYARTGVSVGDHPMKLLRARLPPSILGSRAILDVPDGRIVSVGGMVICRQRPGTASGVVFFTLEDEDGFLNVVLYNRVYEQFRHVALNSPLLLVRGKVQKEKPEKSSSREPPLRIGAVVHVVATHLEELTANAAPVPGATAMPADLHAMSRNFH